MLKPVEKPPISKNASQPPLGGCVLKPLGFWGGLDFDPAAFRRLCVETSGRLNALKTQIQPPLGGCVLKPLRGWGLEMFDIQPPLGGCVLKPRFQSCPNLPPRQPPLGGCVLKLSRRGAHNRACGQPPLGGCVLKLLGADRTAAEAEPAAFRRLCVETTH